MKRVMLALALSLVGAATAVAASKEVAFSAADGFTLKGTLHSTGRGGPGILLLHQCNADRGIYDVLGTMLSTAGYTVLAVDFRGFGGSKGGEYTDFASKRQKLVELMPSDVDAALKFLTSQSTVNPRALGAVAGSCGVTQAIGAARRHEQIRTLVLLSGGTDAEGEAHIKSAANLPILGVASEEDTSAAASIKKILGLSPHQSSRVDMLKDAGHAASMFEKQPELQADIVIWFRANLPVAGYGLPPAIR